MYSSLLNMNIEIKLNFMCIAATSSTHDEAAMKCVQTPSNLLSTSSGAKT